VLSQEERRRVAYHEMGHALVAASLPDIDPVLMVSIVPRGIGALGYTIQRPSEDRFLLTSENLENRVAVLMGGRAAESLIFNGIVSTGAADDLQRATEIATEMVTRYGMDETVGRRTYAAAPQKFLATLPLERSHAAEATVREIDLAVKKIVDRAFEHSVTTLKSRKSDLDQGAMILLAKETLTADEFPAIRQSKPQSALVAASVA
jgi:cell division protease FtsH